MRYLRPVQFYGRLWFRLYRPRPDPRPAPALRGPSRGWVVSARRPPAMLGPETFRFLNATHRICGRAGWNDPALDKLWLYNLHYFDDLSAEGAAARIDWQRALLGRWVAENPPGVGNGWEPYPTSLRIVNWVRWALAGQALAPECVHSLAVQVRWLRRRLEHHLLGNHLFANAKALAFAGAFFVGSEAAGWLAEGQRLLTRELREQVLPDGGHFERSPMYHAILLEDVLDLLNLAGAYPGVIADDLVAVCREKATAMRHWLAVMCHPDGEIGFFNDAALGIAPSLAALVAYGERLGVGVGHPGWIDGIEAVDGRPGTGSETVPGTKPVSIWLRDSGYVRLEAGPAVALLDMAAIGPDYIPGHAHADTLSFELSLFGQRVIVNGGTSRYGSGPERLAERGTAAHSTVQIDGADSSEVWGGFRVARRARPFAVAVSDADSARGAVVDPGLDSQAVPAVTNRTRGCQVTAAHDGYCRLPGRSVHRRTWCLSDAGLSVIDALVGEYTEALARFHLHPAIAVDLAPAAVDGQRAGRLLLPGRRAIAWRVHGGTASVVPDQWHPEFGVSQPSHCLVVRIDRGGCRVDFDWGHRLVLSASRDSSRVGVSALAPQLEALTGSASH